MLTTALSAVALVVESRQSELRHTLIFSLQLRTESNRVFQVDVDNGVVCSCGGRRVSSIGTDDGASLLAFYVQLDGMPAVSQCLPALFNCETSGAGAWTAVHTFRRILS